MGVCGECVVGGEGDLVVGGCCETTGIKGAKLEKGTNLKENLRKYETKHCFAVSRNNSKHFFRIFVFFSVCETIETRRNSDLFRTVSYFTKLKKNKKLSTLGSSP